MATYYFQGYRGRAQHRFTCPACGKASRVRSFTVEHTVNPLNKGEDGLPKQGSQVQRDAQRAAVAQRDNFAKAPLCAKCEEALSYSERRALSERRAS